MTKRVLPVLLRALPALLIVQLCARSSLAAGASAAQGSPAKESAPGDIRDKEPKPVPLAHELGLSLAYQAPLSLDKPFAAGGGVTYTLHYLVTSRSSLGVHLGLRAFPTAPWHLAVGYGLTFTHHLRRRAVGELPSGLFFRYGLLLQMSWLEDRRGTATGHDTLLAVGYDFPGHKSAPFVLAGYHLTQVRNFDQATLWWPYTEIAFGVHF